MKYSKWLGILSAVLLIGSCFIPWTWYPDLQKDFSGFFTHNNNYGKPGKVFLFLVIFAVSFFLIPRLWATRWNLFICALILAYAVKCFILFSSCYGGICPEKKIGIWLMLGSSALMMLMAVFPDFKLKNEEREGIINNY